MQGKLRLNPSGRWEIVDDLGGRLEIAEGDLIQVEIEDPPTEDMAEALAEAWACIEHLSQYAPLDMQVDVLKTLKMIVGVIPGRWTRTRIEHGPSGYYAVEGVSLREGQCAST